MSEPDKVAELRAALEARSQDAVLGVLASLTEPDRRAIRKALMPWVLEELNDWRSFLDEATKWSRPEEYRRLQEKFGRLFRTAAKDSACFDAFRLAVVACGARKDVERVIFSTRMVIAWWDHKLPPERHFHYLAGRELLRREEEWRDEMLLRMVEHSPQDWWSGAQAAYRLGLHLWQERRLAEEDLLPRLSRQARRLGLHPSQSFAWEGIGLRIVRAALEDREEPLLASIDMDGHITQGVVEAVRSGQFDRAEILALVLRRLAESSRAFEANWWGRLLDALEPTEAELEEQADAVLDLIGAPNPRAVSAGLAAAGKLLRKRRIEPVLLVPVLSLAVTSPAVGSAKTALTLLRRCGEQDPDWRLEAFTTALTALQHPKPAVHDALLQWLESDTWWRDDPEALYQVAEAAVHAPAAAAVRLDALMPQDGEADAPASALAEPDEPTTSPAEDLRVELDARLAGEPRAEGRAWLSALRAALDGGPMPEWSPDLSARWRQAEPFQVPATVEETAHLLLRVTAGALTVRDWERIAFGVRLPASAAEQAMLPRLLDPVLRLREMLSEPDSRARHVDWTNAYGALWVAEAWTGRPTAPLPKEFAWVRGWLRGANRARVRSVVAAIRRADTLPCLGTPTHQSGWLDPLVFAQRLGSRCSLPEEEFWDLTSALYRLAPDTQARRAAWQELQPALSRLGQFPALMLSAALAEGREGERSQVELTNWYRGAAGGMMRQVQARSRDAVGWARSLLGLEAPAPETEATEAVAEPLKVRQLTAPLRCRHGMAPITVLEFVRDQLPRAYRALLDRNTPVRSGPAWIDDASEWLLPGGFCPELAGLAPAAWQLSPDYAFEFPPVGPEIARVILDQPEFFAWSILPAHAVPILRNPDCAVVPYLPLLIRALPFNTEQAAQIVDLWVVALRDGRLRLCDLVDTLVPALSDKQQKPRSVLGALELLARQYPPARDAAILAVERTLATARELNAGDRVRLLELLLQWHSEKGSAVPPGAARASLESLAAKGKSTRAGSLARQLLDLVPRTAGTAEAACRLHDIRLMAGQQDPIAPTHELSHHR